MVGIAVVSFRRRGSSTVVVCRSPAAVLGYDRVVAKQDESTGEDSDDGDDEGGEIGAGVLAAGVGVGGKKRRRRREDDVAPLWAVEAAEALRAVLEIVVVR